MHKVIDLNTFSVNTKNEQCLKQNLFEMHRIIRLPELCGLLGRSKSMLYLDMDPNSKYYKPDFPKPIKLSSRSIGWKAADLYEYINSREYGD